MTKGKILIVEDDSDIHQMIRLVLESRQYEVIAAEDGLAGMLAFDRLKPDLVVLDSKLPGMSGTELCREIRKRSEVPIIFLSSNREADDVIDGLELGADDYVTKPFDPLVFVARVNANLRRAAVGKHPVAKLGRFEIDWKGREVYREGEPVPLFAKEKQLLFFLLDQPNQVFSAEQLYKRVWGMSYGTGEATVKVHISNLRRKLEEDPAEPQYIRTVRGFGYKLHVE